MEVTNDSVLIPAKIADSRVKDILLFSPLDIAFGSSERSSIFNDFVSKSNGIGVFARLQVDQYLSSHGEADILLNQKRNKLLGIQGKVGLRSSFDIPNLIKADFDASIVPDGQLQVNALLHRKINPNISVDGYFCGNFKSPLIYGSRISYKSSLLGMEISNYDIQNIYGIVKYPQRFSFGFKANLQETTVPSPVKFLASFERDGYQISGTYQHQHKIALGIYQSVTIYRRIVNPIEDKRNKFIANYIDTAIESEINAKNGQMDFKIGSSYQLNKNWLFKGNCSTDNGISGTGVFKINLDSAISLTLGINKAGIYAGSMINIGK
jgi:hypothetical protein